MHQQVSQPEAEEDDRYHGLRPWVYYLWQYTGPVLALISIIGLCTSSYEDDDPTVVPRMVAYMVLLLVALVAHETRPYKVGHGTLHDSMMRTKGLILAAATKA